MQNSPVKLAFIFVAHVTSLGVVSSLSPCQISTAVCTFASLAQHLENAVAGTHTLHTEVLTCLGDPRHGLDHMCLLLVLAANRQVTPVKNINL